MLIGIGQSSPCQSDASELNTLGLFFALFQKTVVYFTDVIRLIVFI